MLYLTTRLAFNPRWRGSPTKISVKSSTEVSVSLRYKMAHKHCKNLNRLSRVHKHYTRQTTDGWICNRITKHHVVTFGWKLLSTKWYQRSFRFSIHCKCSVCIPQASAQAFNGFGNSSWRSELMSSGLASTCPYSIVVLVITGKLSSELPFSKFTSLTTSSAVIRYSLS